MNILILDKEPNTCKRLTKQVISLGNEAYVSSSMCKTLKTTRGPSVIRAIFPVIIFSEALTDEDCHLILNNIKLRFDALIRISNRTITEEESCKWKEVGITHWVDSGVTDKEIRKILRFLNKEITTEYHNLSQTVHLSSLEKKLFKCLVEADGHLISREELCQKIWDSEVNSAKLSYLSLMVNNIRLKFSNIGYPRGLIVTKWKKGYKLNLDIYTRIYIR